jgi:selenide, water dikinase
VAQVLSFLPKQRDPNLLVGTETHDDAGVYRVAPDLALVQTVDFFPPVVDDPFAYGRIAAANALSDVYAMGGTPLTALNLVGYPDNEIGPEWLGEILKGGAAACVEAGCTIVGGHSVRDKEIKFGLAVTGTVHPDRIVTNAGAKPGDVLVLTKPLGTGFVTTAAKRQSCPGSLLAAAIMSMTRLNRDGRDAMLAAGVSAATDVTGFGFAGHAFELAEGSRTTLRIRLAALPALPGLESLDVTKFRTRASKTNREYTEAGTKFEGGLDPFRLDLAYDAQTSGGLLIAVPPDRLTILLDGLTTAGTLAAAVVGEVLPRQEHALQFTP